MAPPAWLERAKDGGGEAIAALLNQSLQARGITVRGERQSYSLQLWLTGQHLPPQATLVDYLCRAIERLQVPSIGILQITAEDLAQPEASWSQEISLLAASATWSQRQTTVVPSAAPPPDISSPLSQTADSAESPLATEPPLDTESPLVVESLPANVVRAYRELGLPEGTPLDRVESTYFRAKADLLRQGQRAQLEPMKWAYATLKDYFEQPPHSSSPAAAPQAELPLLLEGMGEPEPSQESFSQNLRPSPPEAAALIQSLLQERNLPAQVRIQEQQLHIRWPAVRVVNPKQATAQIYTLLLEQNLAEIGLGAIETLVVSALNSHNQVVWRQTLAMPQAPSVEVDTDLMSFQNRYSNGLIFPALLALGLIMNAMPIVNFLLRGIRIWIHEFGHATVAWMAGRQALPLPFGWTSVNPERSLLVYLGLATLLWLMYWAGRREKKRWPMILAGVLAGVQFVMTWLVSANTFDMLLAFGGIGGELYLSALLMVSFFFPLPTYFRWDFYRYPVVLGAAFTFWGQFWLWKLIRFGRGSIPFGGMWGDAEHGDMNILANRHGCTPGDIIGTYNTIANLSLLIILIVYGVVLYRQHHHRLLVLRQRWMAKS